MPGHAEIRPLTLDDVMAADRTAWTAMRRMMPPELVAPDGEREPWRAHAAQEKMRHLLSTDAGGCWVAETTAGIVGVSLALLRDGLWGLSLLAVHPDAEGSGIGRSLLRAALGYGPDARAGVICSSTHPAALRSYFRAGFSPRPALALAGALNGADAPAGLRSRPGDVEADAHVLQHAAVHVRGASYHGDVAAMVQTGRHLMVCEDRGFAVHHDGSLVLLCAVDEEAARDLMHSCFAAAAPGTTVSVDFVTAGNDWAIEVGLAWGLALSPDGPVFTRGVLGTGPWIPSGAYL